MWAKLNLPAGVAFLVLGVLTLTVLIPRGIESPPSVQFRALSPSYWPTIISIVLSLIGVALMASSFVKRGSHQLVPEAESNAENSGSAWLVARPYIVFAICIALYVGLDELGFVLAGTIGMALLMLIGGERRILLILGFSTLIPLTLYTFFLKAAGVPIPTGVLEPLLQWI